MFDHFRQASSPMAKVAASRCSGVSAARKDRAASIRGDGDTPVFSIANSPGTIPPLVVIPWKGSASPVLARSSIGVMRGGRSNGRIAGVGGLLRNPNCADSPAMLASPMMAPQRSALRPGQQMAAAGPVGPVFPGAPGLRRIGPVAAVAGLDLARREVFDLAAQLPCPHQD